MKTMNVLYIYICMYISTVETTTVTMPYYSFTQYTLILIMNNEVVYVNAYFAFGRISVVFCLHQVHC